MCDLISKEEVLNLIDTAFESGAFDGRYAYENLIDAVQNLIHPLETDLVSRQAVIDTIETDCSWDMFNEWGNRTPTGELIVEAIKRVPSVEPEKCGDCISRKAATDRFDLVQSDDKCMGYDDIMAFLSSLPSVDPERKRGKWVDGKCNKCGANAPFWAMATTYYCSDYCPNCGAKMEVNE